MNPDREGTISSDSDASSKKNKPNLTANLQRSDENEDYGYSKPQGQSVY